MDLPSLGCCLLLEVWRPPTSIFTFQPTGQGQGKRKGKPTPFTGTALELHVSFQLISYWPEPSHIMHQLAREEERCRFSWVTMCLPQNWGFSYFSRKDDWLWGTLCLSSCQPRLDIANRERCPRVPGLLVFQVLRETKKPGFYVKMFPFLHVDSAFNLKEVPSSQQRVE